MEYTTLGRTGLKVSVAGLGCGGFSKLGLGTGKSEDEAVALIRQALDLGVNVLDTAAVYGTEQVVGKALRGVPREFGGGLHQGVQGGGEKQFHAEKVLASLDGSLRRLGVDYVDVFQLHAVHPTQYDQVRDVIVPALRGAREQGKFRFLGITETSPNDPEHTMMNRAIQEGCGTRRCSRST